MVPLAERGRPAHDRYAHASTEVRPVIRRTNVFFALLGPEHTAIGLVRIQQASGLVEQFDDASRSWHVLPDASFAKALADRRLDPTRGVALARARGVL
jgi:hypothetical protein